MARKHYKVQPTVSCTRCDMPAENCRKCPGVIQTKGKVFDKLYLCLFCTHLMNTNRQLFMNEGWDAGGESSKGKT
jgi:hypothetical protein